MANRRLGALHSARIAMVSLDFQEVEEYQRHGDWQRAAAHEDNRLVGRHELAEYGGVTNLLNLHRTI